MTKLAAILDQIDSGSVLPEGRNILIGVGRWKREPVITWDG